MTDVPDRQGWRMPAEWERHEGTWLAWPHEAEDWPGKFEPIPWVVADIVRHLAADERVHLLVADAAEEESARTHLALAGADLARVRFFPVPTDRLWTRDYAPIFVQSPEGRLAALDWHFNGWAKYENWARDDAVPSLLADLLGFPVARPTCKGRRVVLEGGSIEVDGAGLLLTTEECLLSPIQARNPALTRGDLEQVFAEHLGIRKVLWLNRGIAGDDTHGHVDDLARFTAPGRVVTVVEEDPRDENFEPLRENLERLRGLTDLQGRPLRVATLPMPEPVFFDGQRLPASYANFYIANGKVLVPTFNDPADRLALNVLAEEFPDRRVVGIHARDLVLGLGTLHCMTQQQPAGSWASDPPPGGVD